jgi:RNA-directed DNA polymerase
MEFQQRLVKFGLELHPEKTRLIEFGRFAAHDRKRRGRESRRLSLFWVSRISAGSAGRTEPSLYGVRTAKKRMVAKLHKMKLELTRLRPVPVALVGDWLPKVVVGYY